MSEHARRDRDLGISLLQSSRRTFPFIEQAFADSAYAAERVATAARITLEIVRKQRARVGFDVHRGRWVVERLFDCLGRNRRLAKDFEARSASAEAFLYATWVMCLTGRPPRAMSF